MSVLRISSPDKEELINAADYILTAWRKYSDASVDILSESNYEKLKEILKEYSLIK